MASTPTSRTLASPVRKQPAEKTGQAARSLDTDTLFASGREVVITHGTEVYRLRLTRLNRLILTK